MICTMEAFMDKFGLLKQRKVQIYKSSSEIRDKISQLIDDDSFVELNTFSFSKNEFSKQVVIFWQFALLKPPFNALPFCATIYTATPSIVA